MDLVKRLPVGVLCHFSRICQSRSAFVARSRIFLTEFHARGYPRTVMEKFVLRFLKTTPLCFAVRSRSALMRSMMPEP